jgi:site-specific DNA-adenine methylase
MQYIGGKANLVRCFWQVLDAAIRRSSGRFYEPFVGGFNVVSELLKQRVPIKGRPQCSDKHAGLIGMYQALVDGSFVPPASISKEKYLALREQKASDPLSVFASFACAFSGREWASYARGINRNYADCGRRLLAKKRFAMSQCQFFARDFRDSTPEAGSVIYCDPPYINSRILRVVPTYRRDLRRVRI